MIYIEKLKLLNFKRFHELTFDFDKDFNTIIGDNESGKSTILLALDLVLSGSRNKVENIGTESLFNKECIQKFLKSDRNHNNLPELYVEIYLSEQFDEDLNGNNNSEHKYCDGLRLRLIPDDLFIKDIINILRNDEENFPFEFYKCDFTTFQGSQYSGYRRFINHIFVDNSRIGSEYAMKEYVNNMYNSWVEGADLFKYQNQYRKYKNDFNDKILKEMNEKINEYQFGVKNDAKSNLRSDLTIFEDSIAIENKGKGKQCFIKTEFALKKSKRIIDIVLIEEPENHLSHSSMQLLINKISEVKDRQIFIATHNNLISSRLDLRKAIMLSSTSETPTKLKDIDVNTAKFFMKAPDHNILEFILSKKVILVEGDAEYILMRKMFECIVGKKETDYNVTIIAIGGTAFKRYLNLAKMLLIKTAVIRDNDGDYENNCIENYKDYVGDLIRIFADKDTDRYTFEVAIYLENKDICDKLFSSFRRALSIQEYMLKNKTEAAFALLNNTDIFNVPKYIEEAIEWIRK
jgi:predicted ATP-dependent endonuclease of OLD family